MKSPVIGATAFLIAILLGFTTIVFAGTIVGNVTFRGDAPAPKALKVKTDQFCISHAKGELSDELVVSKAGAIQNVVISLLKVKSNFGLPKETPVVDQVNCAYTPHVLAVLTGTTVNIRTSDPTLHNVHAHAKKNDAINWAMPIKDMALPYKTKASEVVRLTCDVHNWMSAYIVVLDNPYFAVIGAEDKAGNAISASAFRASQSKGSYQIEKIPAGKYRVRAWHETLGIARKQVEVPETGEVKLSFTNEDFVKKGRKLSKR